MCTARVGLSSHPVLPLARASVCVWRYFDEIGSSCQPLIFRESVVRTIDAHAGACCHDSAYTLSMATCGICFWLKGSCQDEIHVRLPHCNTRTVNLPQLPAENCHGAYGRQNRDDKTGRGHESSFSLNRQAQSLRPAHQEV